MIHAFQIERAKLHYQPPRSGHIATSLAFHTCLGVAGIPPEGSQWSIEVVYAWWERHEREQNGNTRPIAQPADVSSSRLNEMTIDIS